MTGPFVFDDLDHIPKVSAIRLTNLSLVSLKHAAFDAYAPSRPVANLTIDLNYYFGEYNTFGYHIVNVVIHLTVALLLFFLIKAIINLPANHSYDKFWLPAISPGIRFVAS